MSVHKSKNSSYTTILTFCYTKCKKWKAAYMLKCHALYLSCLSYTGHPQLGSFHECSSHGQHCHWDCARRSCWIFALQQPHWKYDYLGAHLQWTCLPTCYEYSQNKIRRRKPTINTSPMMVLTAIPAMAPGDKQGRAVWREIDTSILVYPLAWSATYQVWSVLVCGCIHNV